MFGHRRRLQACRLAAAHKCFRRQGARSVRCPDRAAGHAPRLPCCRSRNRRRNRAPAGGDALSVEACDQDVEGGRIGAAEQPRRQECARSPTSPVVRARPWAAASGCGPAACPSRASTPRTPPPSIDGVGHARKDRDSLEHRVVVDRARGLVREDGGGQTWEAQDRRARCAVGVHLP
jgi:hypothetical protein